MDTTLVKGLAVMEWMARAQKDCRVIDVATALDLPRSNAHRTLQTLVECGWVTKNADSTYRAGLRLFELGTLVQEALDIKGLLRPILAKLAAATGETIHLTVLDGSEILYLDKFDSPLPVVAYSRIGGRGPACCLASGKAILAAMHLDDAELAIRVGKLEAYTPKTITQIDQLQADLARARTRGWAENREEWRLGVCGLGAPVFDARGEPIAAIGISVPSIRFTRAQASALARQLLDSAQEACKALGYHRGSPPALSSKPK